MLVFLELNQRRTSAQR